MKATLARFEISITEDSDLEVSTEYVNIEKLIKAVRGAADTDLPPDLLAAVVRQFLSSCLRAEEDIEGLLRNL